MSYFKHHLIALSRILAKAIAEAEAVPNAWEPVTVEHLAIIRQQLDRLEELRRAARN